MMRLVRILPRLVLVVPFLFVGTAVSAHESAPSGKIEFASTSSGAGIGVESGGGLPVLASDLDELKAQVEILMRKVAELEAKQAETAKQAKEARQAAERMPLAAPRTRRPYRRYPYARRNTP